MTKAELEEIVERVFISWNQKVPTVREERQRLLKAWWRPLNDLTADQVNQAVDALLVTDTYMPNPGAVRRHSILSSQSASPSALEAWASFQSVAQAASNGQYVEVDLHPCTKEVIRRLGGTASYSMHTNGDRQAFIEVYNTVAEEWLRTVLAIKPPSE
jgi:hypothetical protein